MSSVSLDPAGPPLTAAKIRDFEKKSGRSLPAEYRAFLLKQNGGRPDRTVFNYEPRKGHADGSDVVSEFFSIGARRAENDLSYALETWDQRIPERMLPIARTVFGNLVCLSCAAKDKGRVFFWDHEEEADEGEKPREDNLYRAGTSLSEFMKNLYEPALPDWEEACTRGDVAGVRRWLDEKRPKKKALQEAARLAAMHGKVDVLKVLVERGASLGGLLAVAAQNGHLNVVKHLLASKVKVAEGDLMAAAGGGDLRVVKLLLARGADVNEGPVRRVRGVAAQRWSPLMSAAQIGSMATVKLLLAHGADPLVKDEFGQSAADRARFVAAWKVVSLLEKAAQSAARRRKR
jgi:SMI1 / KNR4 family (SUKH-1)/Ankyrin repeats (3 copies)